MKTINPSTSFRANAQPGRTIKFFTLGCKVNQYETQMLREQFLRAGFKELGNGNPSDIYLINTCTVTHRADAESLSVIRKAHRENPKARIIVTGCLAELDTDKINDIKGVTGIFKNSEKKDIIYSFVSGEPAIKRLNESTGYGISSFKGHTRAFLKIQDGCNNFCSYCKVPLARGRQKSRPLKEIILEAKKLVQNDFKEIVLTGVCLGSYGKDLRNDATLAEVINSLENIRGLSRIRLSSIETSEVTSGLIDKLCGSKKLCRHLHIPLQSGDDAILRKMNRQYTQKDYLNLIARIKKRISDVSITTDCLVGFPGETEDNFNNTIKVIKQVVPLKVHIFPYSPRPGTLASGFPGQLSQGIVKERTSRLKKVADDCSLEYRNKFLARTISVLVENRVMQRHCLWEGHSGNYIKVRFASRARLGNHIVPVRLEGLERDFMVGAAL